MQDPILEINSPCVILAGAGTGKTHTIVEKIKYLIKNEIFPPERIVCITFSNEAANSLQNRVQKFLNLENKQPIIKTFHAFSSDLLHLYGDKISINKDFKILTPDEAKVVLHKNLKITSNNCHKYISSIGTAKDLGISIQQLEKYLETKKTKFPQNLEKRLENLQFELQTLYLKKEKDKHSIVYEIKQIKDILSLEKFIKSWSAYEKLKEKKNYLDYSDLNKLALKLLKTHPEISSNYDYIIVDEFQDTNKIQLDLLLNLSPQGKITIVGDLNQSIYRFRGAYNKNFQEFKSHFNLQNEQIYNLDKSYRSSNKILKIAHSLIINNYNNPEETFLVKNKFNREGDKIQVYSLKNAKEEARKVAEIVKKEIESGTDPREICIMFRAHQYGRIIKQTLELNNVPYTSLSQSSLLKQNSVKTIIDYLTILNNLKHKSSQGSQAWWDIIYNLNFESKDLIALGKFMKENKDSENLSAKLLNNLTLLELSQNGNSTIKILVERIKLMLPFINEDVPSLMKKIFNFSGLLQNDKTKESLEASLNLNKLYELALNHSSLHEPDLTSFINYLEILKDLKIEIQAPRIEESGVRLMSLHAAKGLEYKKVIITNLAQKRFPIERITNNSLIPLELSPEFSHIKDNLDYFIYEHERKHQLFEERRLCYVAFTRAKENLILTYAEKYNNKEHFPSQFLNEIKFKENSDLQIILDMEEKYHEPELKSSSYDFSTILNSPNFNESLLNIVNNHLPIKIEKELHFSPSSLLLFEECQKKYEYKYIFNMPEEKTISWDAIRLGSFIHFVLEHGVKNNFSTLKEFLDYSKELHTKEEWDSIELEESEHLIKVFFERNKNKYNKNSKTEQFLKTQLDQFKFVGFADRIDFSNEGIEIIDYKTGNSIIKPKNRNWQLGYYALAAQPFGKVKKITLEMLKHERPLEFTLDNEGNAKSSYSRMEFNIYQVKDELIETAKEITNSYKSGFKPCPIEKNCEFCNEYVY